MKLTITIEMDNDAYTVDPESPESPGANGEEVSRQLFELARKINDYILYVGDVFIVADINGNYTLNARVDD